MTFASTNVVAKISDCPPAATLIVVCAVFKFLPFRIPPDVIVTFWFVAFPEILTIPPAYAFTLTLSTSIARFISPPDLAFKSKLVCFKSDSLET